MTEVEIQMIGVDDLDVVEPLWSSLREHHASLLPELGAARERADSWARRRALYVEWLGDPDAFVLVARRRGEPALGYALVRIAGGSATWPQGERSGDLETLSVLPTARGLGIGTRLIERVRDELARRGIDRLSLHAIAANADAIRFYERHGFSTLMVAMTTTVSAGE